MTPLEIADRVINGEADALKSWIELKKLEKELKEAMDIIKDDAVSEAEKYGGKSFEAFGAKVEVKNGPGQWKFDKIPEHAEAKEKLKIIETMAKEAFNLQKKNAVMYDTVTGEAITPAEYTEGKTLISISLKS